MDHFGMALGIITVTVIGGAVVYDKSISHEPATVATAAATTPAQSQPAAPDVSATTAAAPVEPPRIKLAAVTPVPAASHSTPARRVKSDVPSAPAAVDVPAPAQDIPAPAQAAAAASNDAASAQPAPATSAAPPASD
jgi:hypothetical protein